MKILKKNGYVYFTDLSSKEISSFCKIDAPMLFAATDPEQTKISIDKRNVISLIKVMGRNIDGTTDCKITLNSEQPAKDMKLDKNDLIHHVGEVMKNGDAVVMMTDISYNHCVALIDKVDKYDKDFVNNACFVSYVTAKGKYRSSTVYSLPRAMISYYFVKFPDKNGKPNHMYFFEDDRSLLIFNQKGWDIIYNDSFRSIADIIA